MSFSVCYEARNVSDAKISFDDPLSKVVRLFLLRFFFVFVFSLFVFMQLVHDKKSK